MQEWLDWKYPTKEKREKVRWLSFPANLEPESWKDDYLLEDFPNLENLFFKKCPGVSYPFAFCLMFRDFYRRKKKSYLNNPKRKFPFLPEIDVRYNSYKDFPLATAPHFQNTTQEYYQVRDKEGWLDISEMEEFYNDPTKLIKEFEEVYRFFGELATTEDRAKPFTPVEKIFLDEEKKYLNNEKIEASKTSPI